MKSLTSIRSAEEKVGLVACGDVQQGGAIWKQKDAKSPTSHFSVLHSGTLACTVLARFVRDLGCRINL